MCNTAIGHGVKICFWRYAKSEKRIYNIASEYIKEALLTLNNWRNRRRGENREGKRAGAVISLRNCEMQSAIENFPMFVHNSAEF